MNKAYIILPLLGLLIFGGFYLQFDKEYAAKQAAHAVDLENARKEKIRREAENRDAAVKAAVEAQARRKLEREEKERQDEAKKLARQAAEDRREKNFSDRNKLRDQAARLTKDLTEIQVSLKDIALEKERLLQEGEAQKEYVKKAEANVKYYYDLLDKITAAEKAAAEAAAAAAAAKKN